MPDEVSPAADEVWRDIVDLATDDQVTENDVRQTFTEQFGFSPDEAAVAELLLFRAELLEPPSPPAERHSFAFCPTLGPDWVSVAGGGLKQSIEIRVAVLDGRPRIVGLRIDQGKPISADMLRGLRLADILNQFLTGYTPDGPDVRGLPHSDQNAVLTDLNAWIEWQRVHRFLTESAADLGEGPLRAKRGVAPSDAVLSHFLQVLSEERVKPHGALARTARRIPIAPSTAYRWLDLCRERGILTGPDQEAP